MPEMNLLLKRPLAFFDLETTGISISTDRIVEISVLKIHPGGKKELFHSRVNPGMPVPPQAVAVHGITDEDLREAPSFKEIAVSLATFLEGTDLAGYNAGRFDIPLLAEEFLRAGVDFDFRRRKFIDVQVIFQKKEPRTLSAAYRFYCDRELKEAHSSMADTEATFEILQAQLERYTDLEGTVNKLSEYSAFTSNADFAGRIIFDEEGREVFNFGKYKGRLVEEVLKTDPSYYSWMMNGDFPLYTKKVLTEIRLRHFGK